MSYNKRMLLLPATHISPHFAYDTHSSADKWAFEIQLDAAALFAHCTTALQIRAGQWSITTNLWPLTTHIFNVMIIVTGGFFKKSFYYYYYYYYYYFVEILLNDLELVFLELLNIPNSFLFRAWEYTFKLITNFL